MKYKQNFILFLKNNKNFYNNIFILTDKLTVKIIFKKSI